MKKNMIALAVAGAFVAPVAMADVTVSGGLQAEVVHIGGNGAAPNGMYLNDGMEMGKPNAGSYGFLKFAGTEDLGGGLKALGSYNFQVATDSGVDTRDAFVGLSHDTFGAILAGRLATPYKTSTVAYDPFLATSFQARGSLGMSTLQNGYVNNAIAYANSFAGGMVKVVAALVLDENKNGTSDSTVGKHAKSFSVNVDPISGLDIAVAYIDLSQMSTCSTTQNINLTNATIDPITGNITGAVVTNSTTCGESGKDRNATKIGAKYTMGAFSIAGQVEMLNKGLTGSGEKGNVSYLTAGFKFDDANSINVAGGITDKKVLGGTDNGTYAAVGFTHAFSKNTSAMVGYRQSKITSNDKEDAFGAGLRVNF